MLEIADREYVSNKDTKFTIEGIKANGLYKIVMNKGGLVPSICEGSYTSYVKAEQALEQYLRTTDRRGYAKYPSKVEKNGPRQTS